MLETMSRNFRNSGFDNQAQAGMDCKTSSYLCRRNERGRGTVKLKG